MPARPSDDTLRRAEVAKRALQRAVAAIAPGRPVSVVPDTIQETFREAGYAEGAYHQSGYSIGIAFAPNPHEARMLSLRRGNNTPLQAGMTLFPIANLYGPGPTLLGQPDGGGDAGRRRGAVAIRAASG